MKIVLHKIAKLIELNMERFFLGKLPNTKQKAEIVHFLTSSPNGLPQTNSSQYNVICIVLFEDVHKGLFS